MSYILEALRKAEQERRLGQVPDLAMVCALPSPARRRRWLWLVLVLALLSNAAVLAVVFLPSEKPVPLSSATPAAGQSQPRGAAAAATPAMPPAGRWQSQPAPASPSPPVARMTGPEPTPGMQPAAPRLAPLRKPEKPVSRTAPLETASPPIPAEPVRSKRSAIPRTAPVDVTPFPALAGKPPAGLPDLSVEADRYGPGLAIPPVAARTPSRLPDLPLENERHLPGLNMDVHVYSDQPEKRFVLINSRRYREGEQLSEGPLVEAITRDGAVLRYQGQRFLLSIQH